VSLTDEQLAQRKTGLGGSDVAAILGLNPYAGRWDVWSDKVGLAAPQPENRFTRWGNKLEQVVAEEYAERNNVRVETSKTLRHPTRTWQVGTPDRLVYAPDSPIFDNALHGLEIKCKGERVAGAWGESGTGPAGVPDEVQAQAAWYMSLTTLPRWDVGVLIGGNDFREYVLTRDLDTEAAMLEVAERFWRENVLTGTPPEFDGSGAGWDFLRRKLPGSKRVVDADDIADKLARQLSRARDARQAAQMIEDQLKQQFAAHVVAHGVGGFAALDKSWRFTVGERAGSTSWKKVAEVLAATLNYDAADLEEVCRDHRGAPGVIARLTDKHEKE